MDATSERDDKFRALSERRIREALEAGDFKDLAGYGQPLEIEENPYAPEEWRLAFHVLKQNGFKPDWIELGDEIEGAIAGWRGAADRHFADVRARLERIVSDPRMMRRMREEVAALKAQHARASERHAAALAEINRKIHYFNATVPIQSLKRPTFFVDDELRRFAERLPAYLSY